LLNPKVYPLENIFPNFHRDPNNSSIGKQRFEARFNTCIYST